MEAVFRKKDDGGWVETLTDKYHMKNGEEVNSESMTFIFHCYLDFEILWENINFMGDQRKLLEMMVKKAEKDFQKRKNVPRIKGYENVLCINEDRIGSDFNMAKDMVLRYMAAYFCLGKKEEFFSFGKIIPNTITMVDHVQPIQGRIGFYVKRRWIHVL